MKKNTIQDIVPPKKSIRDVERSSLNRKEDPYVSPVPFNNNGPIKIDYPKIVKPVTPTPPPPVIPPKNPPYKYEYSEPNKANKKWLYFGVFILVLIIAFGVSFAFKSATIRITPKQESKTLSDVFTAKKNSTEDSLSFTDLSINKDIERTLDSTTTTTEQKVDNNAQGKIVIYNNFSSEPQKLIATTRFETPEGLIFRIIEPVTVPGKQTKDGRVVSGSIEVTVKADKPGATYNIGLKDFTIPGLKGSPKYTEIYARSKTEMSGGFSGMQKVISKTLLDKIDNELATELKILYPKK